MKFHEALHIDFEIHNPWERMPQVLGWGQNSRIMKILNTLSYPIQI